MGPSVRTAVVVAVTVLVSLGPIVGLANAPARAAVPGDQPGVEPSDRGAISTSTSTDPDIPPGLRNASGTVQVFVKFREPKLPERQRRRTTDRLQTAAARDQQAIEGFARTRSGVEILNRFWLINAVLVEVDTNRVALRELTTLSGVTGLFPNANVTVPEPPRTPGQGLPAASTPSQTGANATYGLRQIDAPRVWETFDTKGGGVKVAVLDTGVAITHPDIELYTENVSNSRYPGGWAEFNQNGNQFPSRPNDDGIHGTHTSGTVAGGNASGQYIGVAPNVSLMHGNVLGNRGGRLASIIGGMQWAVAEDADVISMSLGCSARFGNTCASDALAVAVQHAQASGTVVIASIGNAGANTSGSPGNVFESLSVGASNSNRGIASFSGGEVIDTDVDWNNTTVTQGWPGEYVVPDVAAPGVAVKSSVPGHAYMELDGTSMATPHVAGVAALVISAAGGPGSLTPREVKRAIRRSAWKPQACDPLCIPRGNNDTRYGGGIINAYSAVLLARNGTTLVAGSVTAAETGDPLGNSTVTVAAATGSYGAEADTSSAYSVPVTNGTSTVTADAFGYGAQRTTVSVSGNSVALIGRDFTLDPTVEVRTHSGRDQPRTMTSKDRFEMNFRVANVENVTVELASNNTVDPGNLTVRIDGRKAKIGDTVTYQSPRTVRNFSITVATRNAGIHRVALRTVFGGRNATTTVGTGSTVVANPVDGCRDIASPGRYALNQSLTVNITDRTTCFDITASNVTFFGNGHYIYMNTCGDYCLGRKNLTAIHLNGSRRPIENVSISRQELLNWERGLLGERVRKSEITDTVVAAQLTYGIILNDSVDIQVKSNYVVPLFGFGTLRSIRLNNVTSSGIHDNLVYGTNDGIELRDSSHNTITRNHIASNTLGKNDNYGGRLGLLNESNHNLVRGNTLLRNEPPHILGESAGHGAIDVFESTGNTLVGNYVAYTKGSIDAKYANGIFIYNSSPASISDNVATRNAGADFVVSGDSVVTVTNLTITPRISFTGTNVELDGVTGSMGDGDFPDHIRQADLPNGTFGVGLFVEVREHDPAFLDSESWALVNMSYGEYSVEEMAEPTLNLWNITEPVFVHNWSRFGGVSGVHTEADYVHANITNPEQKTILGVLGTSCRNITSPGTYHLQDDVWNAPADGAACTRIKSSGVTLDGQGYRVDGSGAGTTAGLLIDNRSRVSNVTIRDVTVTDWAQGVTVVNASGVNLTGVAARDNEFLGLFLQLSSNVRVVGSRVAGHRQAGILALNSPNTTVADSTVRDSRTGVSVYDSNGTVIADTTVRNNDYVGLSVTVTANSTVRNLTATGNAYGVLVSRSLNTTIHNSTLAGNDRVAPVDVSVPKTAGVFIDRARRTTVRSTSIDRNQGPGALLRGATGTTLGRVSVANNSDSGLLALNSTATLVSNSSADRNRMGLEIINGSAPRLVDVRARANEFIGIDLRASPDAVISNATLRNPGADGIIVSRSPNTSVLDTVANDNYVGVNVLGSNRTTVADTTARNNSYAGVATLGAVDVHVRNVTATGNAYGVLIAISLNTTIHDSTLEANDRVAPVDVAVPKTAGLVLTRTRAAVIRNTSLDGNRGVGAVVLNATDTHLRRISALNTSRQSVYIDNGSVHTVADRVRLIPSTTVSFRGEGVAVGPASSIPPFPTGYTGVGVALNVTNTTAGGWVALNASYASRNARGLNESSLAYWTYNGTWTTLPTVTDPAANVVGTNVTTIRGSAVYAALGTPKPLPAGYANYGNTSRLNPNRTSPSTLSHDLRTESGVGANTSVRVGRSTSTTYTLNVTVAGSAENVTFFLRRSALAGLGNLSRVTLYVDGTPREFVFTRANGSTWVVFRIENFSTRTVTFVAPAEATVALSNATGTTGTNVTVALTTTAESLTGYHANVTFNASVLEAVGVRGVAFPDPSVEINNTAGWVTLSDSGPTGPPDPTLARLIFRVREPNATNTSLSLVPADTSLTTATGPVPIARYRGGHITVLAARPGDVNGDGAINTGDVIQVQRSIVGLSTDSTFSPAAADVNSDGSINTGDVIQIQRFIVGLPSVLN